MERCRVAWHLLVLFLLIRFGFPLFLIFCSLEYKQFAFQGSLDMQIASHSVAVTEAQRDDSGGTSTRDNSKKKNLSHSR